MRRADQRQHHYIYKITRDDGRYYIGMHSTDDMNDGYFGSGKLITRSIKKHGKERHTKEILETLSTRSLLKEREKELLTEELRADPMCMNIAPGGGGGFVDEEHQRKCSAAGKRAWLEKMETDLEFRAEYAKRWSSRRCMNSPRFSGKKHSEETKQKMRKPKNVGCANSQFGTCWVTNGTPIKIKKEHLDEYLAQGYSRGRK